MGEAVAKLDDRGDTLLFWCPGCHGPHGIIITEGHHLAWTWNEDFEKPTIEPSILVFGSPGYSTRCHSFVRDGQFQYLSDCEHELKDQTVAIPPLSHWEL